MTQDGEMVTWKGQGIGRLTGVGAVSWRGAVYYQTASEKLARLNGIAGVLNTKPMPLEIPMPNSGSGNSPPRCDQPLRRCAVARGESD